MGALARLLGGVVVPGYWRTRPAVAPIAEKSSAMEVANRSALIVAITSMAKGLGININKLAMQWHSELAHGRVPEMSGVDLLVEITKAMEEE